jgi:uncharacterized membrane protein
VSTRTRSGQDVPAAARGWTAASAGVRLMLAAAVGLVAGTVTTALSDTRYGPAVGWDAAALTFLVGSWTTMRRLDPTATAATATREDPSSGASDAVLLAASVVSLLAVGLLLFGAGKNSGAAEIVRVALGVASIALSWAVVHTVYCLRYARLYYTEPVGGLDNPGDEPPAYADFAYVAFTVGMTFQVSDTGVSDAAIRAVVLRHALLSFLFGTVILATTINLVAGLSK